MKCGWGGARRPCRPRLSFVTIASQTGLATVSDALEAAPSVSSVHLDEGVPAAERVLGGKALIVPTRGLPRGTYHTKGTSRKRTLAAYSRYPVSPAWSILSSSTVRTTNRSNMAMPTNRAGSELSRMGPARLKMIAPV